MRRALVVLICLTVTVALRPLAAQRLASNSFPRAELGFRTDDPRTPRDGIGVAGSARASDRNVGRMILGGVALGAAGLVGGALAGDRFQRYPCEDCIEGAFYGALAGESLAIPIGVHLANHSRGNVTQAIAASLGIGALGLGAAVLTDEWGVLFAIPVLQLGASVGIERHTARDHP